MTSASEIVYLDAEALTRALPWTDAVDALADAFAHEDPDRCPTRSHLEVPGGELLLMPAHGRAGVGVKLVTLNPANPERGHPFIHGAYVLFDPETLAPQALLDGATLTALRTAAVSALATRHLARPDARRLVVFGAGPQGSAHVDAMRAVRPIEDVAIVATRSDRATRLVERLRAEGVAARVSAPDAVAEAELVCTCTTSRQPLFDAAALAPGTHVNAIGAYRPDMRELCGELLARGRLVVETRASALAEAGDVIQAIAEGRIAASSIAGDLGQLVRGEVARADAGELTVFKSVGVGLEDLVLARVALRGR